MSPAPLDLGKALDLVRRHWRVAGFSEVSIANYSRADRRVDAAVDGLLAGTPEEQVLRLRRWRESLQKRVDAETLSRAAVMSDRAALVSFFDALVAQKKAAINPARQVACSSPPKGAPRPIPASDLDKLLRQPDVGTPEGLRDRAILELLRHGLRQTEVRHLMTHGVEYDADNKRVWIDFRAKGKRRQRRTRDLGLEESGGMLFARYLLERWAPGDWPAWEALAASRHPKSTPYERRMQALCKLIDRLRREPSVPVFQTDGGQPLYARWVNRMFERYRTRAGLDAAWGPHSLRHRFCTSLLEGNVDLRDSMRLSGHEDIRSLMIYTQSSRTRAATNIDAVGPAPVAGGVL